MPRRCKLVALRYHFLTTHRRLTNLLPPQLLSFWGLRFFVFFGILGAVY
ncbi:MAG: hypothetical protein ACKERG_02840 [Candidatus Hodgkinia cicadicola]